MKTYQSKEEAEKNLKDPMDEAWCPIAQSLCVSNCISRVKPMAVDVSTYKEQVDGIQQWKAVHGYCTSPLVTGGIEIKNMWEIRRYI